MNLDDNGLPRAFLSALGTPERSAEIDAADDLYGWLVGSWKLDVLHYRGEVPAARLTGEAHFGWVLEGRAIQDVWIMPARGARTAPPDPAWNMYGTTQRVWDPALRAWRITWTNPVNGHREEQIGRRESNDIVQLGTRADGTATRWRFTEITPDSFHWIGDALAPGATAWRLEGEFLATRTGP
ncbi:hypothetical protein FAZ95_07215 [Trinickia violacea]|uniref:DUF1579 domain-containing protein n=1 Tax=Trinickia violacea TaxID=2571746 RepID=A0A4P8IT30_9BURK|nr:hypothetical protein [Trinickia violacea]QCP48989.1 hypothetical protein FAZ95_07215 [Trinickia violacea]